MQTVVITWPKNVKDKNLCFWKLSYIQMDGKRVQRDSLQRLFFRHGAARQLCMQL